MTGRSGAFAGIDTGGTFTDLVASIDGELVVDKVLSDADDPGRAVLDVLGDRTRAQPDVVHGTTVATNALLERRGARVALVTTAGFEDVIEIGRQSRPLPYALDPRRAEPLVPRACRFGVPGPLGPEDAGRVRPEAAELVRIARALAAADVEAVAVCLLFSYLDSGAENRVLEAISTGPWSVSLSSRVLPVFREYERASTTVANAYVAPVMGRYLRTLDRRTPGVRFRVMASSAGSLDLETAAELPAACLLSGPAGGVLGAARVAEELGIRAFMTLDMGGTSTDVCLVDGAIPTSAQALVDGLPVAFPTVDIHTVGAGGGSIVRIDAAGVLRVGPESAGADPGPIAYGRGRLPTVTDANVFLGRIPAAAFEAVRRRLLGADDAGVMERIEHAFVALGERLGAASEGAAAAALQSVEASMARALRVISTRRGRDPRDFALMCFGGAGGLHGAALADALGIERVIVPPFPGVLSAYGLATADRRRDYVRAVLTVADRAMQIADLERLAAPLVEQARREHGDARIDTHLDLRYQGQSYEIEMPLTADFRAAFQREHLRRFGHASSERPIEIVHVRVKAVAPGARLALATGARSSQASGAGSSPTGGARSSPASGEAGQHHAAGPCIERHTLASGASIAGPVVVTEATATTWIPSGWQASVAANGALVLTHQSH